MNVQYLSIENCKSQNEIQIFEIMEYYTAVFTGDRATSDIAAWANGIRNEAAEILNSRLTGDSLALLQAKFLSKFNEWYKIGDEKIPTNFDEYLKGVYLEQRHNGTTIIKHKIDVMGTGFIAAISINDTTARRIIGNCKIFHELILQGCAVKGGKFVQC